MRAVGSVHALTRPEPFTTAKGDYVKCEIVLDVTENDKYPKYLMFEFFGKEEPWWGLEVNTGDMVRIDGWSESRYSDKSDRWFTGSKIKELEILERNPRTAHERRSAPPPFPPPDKPGNQEPQPGKYADDEIPF